MRKTIAIIVLAALPTVMAVPGFSDGHCTSTHRMDTDASDPLALRYARDAGSGFGRWPLDSLIECLGGEESNGVR